MSMGKVTRLFLLSLLFTTSCETTVKSNFKETIVGDEEKAISTDSSKVSLGSELFNDTNLSLDRTMSCATCHDPDSAFIDSRTNGVDGAVSLGQDDTSLGDRNSPTITYARFIPAFQTQRGVFLGGQFLDGRASLLVDQAGGPFLDALEMQMPSEQSVVERIMENSDYITSFQNIYGANIFNNTTMAFNAIKDAIAEFESSDTFAPFDSNFDRGTLTAQELRGQALFRQVRCDRCHSDDGTNPLFTNFRYENLGVPANSVVRALNGQGTDEGLFENPNVTGTNQRGKFRVSTLRNVGVTAPYMHNGVFQELKTVVHFYNTRDVPGAINPETGLAWESAEISTNVETTNVGNLGLSDSQEDDIVAFLRTLTDQQYE